MTDNERTCCECIPPVQPDPDTVAWAPGQAPVFGADRKLERERDKMRTDNVRRSSEWRCTCGY